MITVLSSGALGRAGSSGEQVLLIKGLALRLVFPDLFKLILLMYFNSDQMSDLTLFHKERAKAKSLLITLIFLFFLTACSTEKPIEGYGLEGIEDAHLKKKLGNYFFGESESTTLMADSGIPRWEDYLVFLRKTFRQYGLREASLHTGKNLHLMHRFVPMWSEVVYHNENYFRMEYEPTGYVLFELNGGSSYTLLVEEKNGEKYVYDGYSAHVGLAGFPEPKTERIACNLILKESGSDLSDASAELFITSNLGPYDYVARSAIFGNGKVFTLSAGGEIESVQLIAYTDIQRITLSLGAGEKEFTSDELVKQGDKIDLYRRN
jgi:hypothetical protein